MRLKRALTTRNAFLALKALNLVAITTYSFLLIYILVRVLTFDVYPVVVQVSAVGIYIMATDLGYSGFVYYRTRQSFLLGGMPHGSEAATFTLYMVIALFAALAMGGVLACVSSFETPVRFALALYFLSIVLALPWGLLRKIAAAVDLFLTFEVYEFGRRMAFLTVAAAMLAGLPFLGFAALCLVVWAVAFAMALVLLQRRRQMVLTIGSPAIVFSHLQSNFRNIWQSGSLTLAEFIIYNFPYIAIPLLFPDKRFIIAFDIFYKISRFGSVSYAVPAESMLPAQTRAFFARDRQQVLYYYRLVILIGALPLATVAVAILGFGDRLFTALLARGGVVDASVRLAMTGMLVAMLLQNAAGTFLVGTGNYAQLSRFAWITVGLMVSVVAATATLHLTFAHFLYLYVAAYGLHTVFYTRYLFQLRGFNAGPQTVL